MSLHTACLVAVFVFLLRKQLIIASWHRIASHRTAPHLLLPPLSPPSPFPLPPLWALFSSGAHATLLVDHRH
ncbi:hypothetical protein KC19_5G204700 [Ceratodon purpureus]|uniref:Secreted protein n=1 Tax=Ceratodon purpureus TaxID=3225 RepID=A0A8T0I4U8_CERPU|nr:hypothetical protein KC19_5G204700 [Ceratodon purpureus]